MVNENNIMLKRIYGTVSHSKKISKVPEYARGGKKEDHRKLGKDLKLYTFDSEIGPGLPLWLPKGTVIIEEIEKLAKEYERMQGYSQVRTPHLTKKVYIKKLDICLTMLNQCILQWILMVQSIISNL